MKKTVPPPSEIRILWRRRGLFEWRVVDGETGATLKKGVCTSVAAARIEAASILREMKDD